VDTFELLPSLAQGELAETSAPELVAAVFRSRASGTLWMETEDSEIRCFFRAGDMCGTGPFKSFQTLAHVLLANDWVAALDIESSREEASAKGQRHGEVLVEKGLLTADQLRTALGAQHTANLNTLLGLSSGKYDWRGWEPPPPWAREVVVDPISCVINALEQEQHEPRRRRILEWMGQRAARLTLDWPELQDRVMLEPLDRRGAALLALPRTLDEFVRASRLPQTRAEALVVALLLAGGAELQPQSSAPPPPARAAPPPRTPGPPPKARKPGTDVRKPSPAARKSPPAARKPPQREPELEQLEPEHEDLDPLPERETQDDELELLHPAPVRGARPTDPFSEPQLQGSRPLDELEPEPELLLPGSVRHSAPSRRAAVDEDEALARVDSLSLDEMEPTADGPPREPQEEPLEIDRTPRWGAPAGGSTTGTARDEPTFDHALEPESGRSDEGHSRDLRKKMVARGMRNLGSSAPPADQAQNRSVQVAPQKRAHYEEGELSAEDQRFVDDVRSRARMAQGQNAYARLGVAPTASNDQIKNAYLGLAKRYHPDRSSAPGLAGLQPELQSLFGLLKDAYDAIATAEARARYEAQKAGGNKPATRKDEAVLSLKMGEVLLKKRDFEGAINKLRRSVDLDASGDALAALAWALVADPKGSPATKEEAASLINRALRAPGVTARTYYVAGVLWRTRDPDSAVDAFRKALELDPSHSDAALELRLIEQRRGKQGKTGGGVLSGLLFGKRKS
jgi:tetratricopeptide (TPR) repeat protein